MAKTNVQVIFVVGVSGVKGTATGREREREGGTAKKVQDGGWLGNCDGRITWQSGKTTYKYVNMRNC